MKGDRGKAGGLALLVGAPGSGSDEDDGEDIGMEDGGYDGDTGPSDEEAVAAEDALAAIRSRDSGALAEALRDFVEACMAARESD